MPLRESDIVPLLEKAPDLGLKLGWEGRDTLTVQPAEPCPPDFADTLRAYIRRLLSLDRVNLRQGVNRHSMRPSSSARTRPPQPR